MSNAIVLAGDPSTPSSSNGKQTKKTLLPLRFFKFEFRFSIIPTEFDNNILCVYPNEVMIFGCSLDREMLAH
jgi:hypothetical protein